MQLADSLRMKHEQCVSGGGLSASVPGSLGGGPERSWALLEPLLGFGSCSVPGTLQGAVM